MTSRWHDPGQSGTDLAYVGAADFGRNHALAQPQPRLETLHQITAFVEQ